MESGEATKVRDVVCDMQFKPSKAVAIVSYEGRDFYFCTDACRRQFERDPIKYALRAQPETTDSINDRP